MWVAENDWIAERATTDWKNHFLRVYAEIPEGSDFKTVDQHIANAELQKIKNIDAYKEEAARNPTVFLHPMKEWHLKPIDRETAQADTGPMRMLWLVSTIGMFVLLLACINFMNLSTARSEKERRKLVSVKPSAR